MLLPNIIKYILCLIILINKTYSKTIFLYNDEEDHLELLDTDNFESIIFNSEKASIVEFYAHWCGRCKRWAQHWKDLAKTTILWHDIIRVGAVDCAMDENKQLCRSQKVEFFPTFYMYEAHAQKGIGKEANYKHNAEQFSQDMLEFLQAHPNRPAIWPSLEAYEGALNDIYKEHDHVNYIIVVFEGDKSYTGRKLIMDFEKFSHKLPIKRTTCIKNINLCKVADVNEFIIEPEVYLVSKVDDVVKINILKNVVQTLNREHVYNTVDFNPDQIDEKDPRNSYLKMIKDFIQYTEALVDTPPVEF